MTLWPRVESPILSRHVFRHSQARRLQSLGSHWRAAEVSALGRCTTRSLPNLEAEEPSRRKRISLEWLVSRRGAAMSVTGASSRAIDSAAVPLHSAALVAARGSSRSSARNKSLPAIQQRTPALRGSGDLESSHPRSWQGYCPPSTTEVDFAPLVPKGVARCATYAGAARVGPAAWAVKLPHRIRLGERCRHGRPGATRS